MSPPAPPSPVRRGRGRGGPRGGGGRKNFLKRLPVAEDSDPVLAAQIAVSKKLQTKYFKVIVSAFGGSNSFFFASLLNGSNLEGKNLLQKEQLLFCKSRPLNGCILYLMEANKKLRKMSHFVKVV